YIPPGPPEPLTFETFAGINTSTTRPGVDEKQMWWCDGFMPIGPQFLRTLYGVGPRLYNTSDGVQIIVFDFVNIGATPYCIVILSDGQIQAINTSTGAVLILAGVGTIQSPARGSVGITSWGSDFVIIVADQPDGYFVWNGIIFARTGSLSPEVVVTNG